MKLRTHWYLSTYRSVVRNFDPLVHSTCSLHFRAALLGFLSRLSKNPWVHRNPRNPRWLRPCTSFVINNLGFFYRSLHLRGQSIYLQRHFEKSTLPMILRKMVEIMKVQCPHKKTENCFIRCLRLGTAVWSDSKSYDVKMCENWLHSFWTRARLRYGTHKLHHYQKVDR